MNELTQRVEQAREKARRNATVSDYNNDQGTWLDRLIALERAEAVWLNTGYVTRRVLDTKQRRALEAAIKAIEEPDHA